MLTSIHLVPATSVWVMSTVFPSSATRSRVRFDVYSCEGAERFAVNPGETDAMKQQSEVWVQRLAETQSAIDCDGGVRAMSSVSLGKVFDLGHHPFCRRLIFLEETQHDILKRLRAHVKLEQLAGEEIYPASPRQTKRDNVCEGKAEKRRILSPGSKQVRELTERRSLQPVGGLENRYCV